jgi:hypothetical protein
MPANGTVAGVNGGTGRVIENGGGSFRIARVFTGQTGTETELWFRPVIAPSSSSATGNTIFSHSTGTNRIIFTNGPNLVIQSINGALDLIAILQIINRAPGHAHETHGWINRTSHADQIAPVNYNEFVSENILEGTDTYNGLTLNLENSQTQGDSIAIAIAIATSLIHLVQPVPGGVPLMEPPPLLPSAGNCVGASNLRSFALDYFPLMRRPKHWTSPVLFYTWCKKNGISTALSKSMKNADTSGNTMNALGDGPNFWVTAVMLAIAVGVEPSVKPLKPAAITAAS